MFILPSVLAISTDLKQSYQPGETLIIEISGNILEPIYPDQVEFKTGKFGNIDVPLQYDIKRLGEKYFLYALLPDEEKNYTLHIKDILTTLNGQSQKIDFSQNFTASGEIAPYSINPGLIITNSEFTLKLISKLDIPQTIETSLEGYANLTLKPGENKISVFPSSLESGFNKIKFGMYFIPVYFSPSENNDTYFQENETNFREDALVLLPLEIRSTILYSEEIKFPIRLTNLKDLDIEDIRFIYDEELFLIDELPEIIPASEYVEFNLLLKNQNSNIDEVIVIMSGEEEIILPVIINFTQNESEVFTPYLQDFSSSSGYLCSELDGRFCSADETCTGEVVSSIDGNSCCIASCKKTELKKDYSWAGYLIGAIILIVLVIVIAKYLKTKKLGIHK